MATKALVGTKIGMTQLWDDDHRVVPVTVIAVDDCRVVRVKRPDVDGYSALVVTYGHRDPRKLNKPLRGVYESAGVDPGTELVELRIDDTDGYEPGRVLGVDLFSEGELVDVTARSKGKGFAGTIKRHGFGGLPASHGAHRVHRAPGSIGACATPARVFKGTRMAGRMGSEKVTTLNLRLVGVDTDRSLLLVKGSVPGPRGGRVIVRDAVKAPAAKEA